MALSSLSLIYSEWLAYTKMVHFRQKGCLLEKRQCENNHDWPCVSGTKLEFELFRSVGALCILANLYYRPVVKVVRGGGGAREVPLNIFFPLKILNCLCICLNAS